MKSFIVLALFALSTSVMAAPKVGDAATFNLMANGVALTYTTELISYDAASNTFAQKNTTTYMGQEQVETEIVPTDDILADEQVRMILAYCQTPQVNGKLKKITVPAGTFDTCEISEGGNTMNIGLVPMGMIKMVNAQVTMELVKFKIGQ